MRVRHILLGKCNPDNEIGVNKAVYFLADHQKALGNDVEIYALSSKAIHNQLVNYGGSVDVHVFTSAISCLRAIRKERSAGILIHFHVPWRPIKLFFALALKIWRIPYIVTTHNAYSPFLLKKSFFVKKIAAALYERLFLNWAVAIHALCREELSDLRDFHLIPPIFCLPNGMQLPQATKLLRRDYFDNIPAASGKLKLGFLGRVAWEKNIEELISAIALLKTEIQEKVLVIIIGPAERSYQNRLEAKIFSLGLKERICFVGPIYGEDKWHAINSLDVYIHPAKGEVFPMAAKEAMSCARPCVISRTSYVSYFYDSDAFVMVEPYAEDIARGISEIIEQRSNWDSIGHNASELIRRNFDRRLIAMQMLNFYEKYSVLHLK